MNSLDDFTEKHLQTWLNRAIEEEVLDSGERTRVLNLISNFCTEYPEVLKDRSWWEILSLAERQNKS